MSGEVKISEAELDRRATRLQEKYEWRIREEAVREGFDAGREFEREVVCRTHRIDLLFAFAGGATLGFIVAAFWVWHRFWPR